MKKKSIKSLDNCSFQMENGKVFNVSQFVFYYGSFWNLFFGRWDFEFKVFRFEFKYSCVIKSFGLIYLLI
jgi:hypothetical protein